MKQGEENTQFIKEPEEKTRDYIFQKDTTTKTVTYVVAGFLVVLIIGVIISIFFFGAPEV